MDLSIIIINWNSVNYLRTCLRTIYTNAPGFNFEVIVLDASSFDGCEKMVRVEFPAVRFIQSEQNGGFAWNNNKAYKIARGRSLLFLNPDTEIQGNAIRTLYNALRSLPKAGIVGARLLNTDRTIQSSCVQAFPTILNQVFNVERLRRLVPKARLWGIRALFDGSVDPVEVDVISGACLMIKRETFERVGLFSAEYFMYSEDVDLCFESRRMGWKSYFVPTATVIHHGGCSSSRMNVSAFSSVMILESRKRFFRKTRSAAYSYVYRVAMLIASIARITVIICAWMVSSNRRRWANSLQTWCARLNWTLGLRDWAKNT